MTDTTLAQDDSNVTDDDTQAEATGSKTLFTQEEVNAMMARTKAAALKKALKPYEDLGDPNELRQLKTAAEKAREEQALKRGEFDKVLQEFASKKDAEIQARDKIIREYKIDLPLINAAATFKSVNPEQVKALLKSQINLNSEGEVEVIDSKGKVRYSDKGTLFQVDDLVKEFLDSNPHFVAPTLATTNSKSSHVALGSGKVDLSKLDMSRPEDRALYARETGRVKT